MSVLAAFILSLVILFLVFDMLRRKKIREKYAALWLLVGVSMLVLAAFPRLLEIIAHTLNVQVPSNLLFALSIVLALGVCLHLSWEISVVEDETRILAEESAILRAQLATLETRLDALTSEPRPSRAEQTPPNDE
ncbi:hypothetical protein ART_1674 [Arthrobacter sp. PAMC 25486]|uniref:DUF2304 domain-containing protein n=1 Tax=Arthrobacter sp. PAMC 25486 TaxID=1494608 RepID=UPI0005361562|nr:DUF2304 domain-containing protein [Arthrobacter sp. PAMC 25486]AIY01273.1 hypothetical protein ART_1674 [Arthrobacter sp. PAMC 25486]